MSLFFPAQNTDQLTVEKQEDTHINQMEQTQKTFKKNTFKAELGSVCGVTTVWDALLHLLCTAWMQKVTELRINYMKITAVSQKIKVQAI